MFKTLKASETLGWYGTIGITGITGITRNTSFTEGGGVASRLGAASLALIYYLSFYAAVRTPTGV